MKAEILARPPNPYHRVLRVKHAIARSSSTALDSLERALYLHVTGDEPNAVLGVAHAIYASEYQREIMQAWVFANTDNETLEKLLQIPGAVSDAYRHLFFDASVLTHMLSRWEWVNTYEGTPRGKELLVDAANGGVAALAWRFGFEHAQVSPKNVIRQAMADAFYRGKSGRNAGLRSPEAAVAHAHMQTAIKAASLLTRDDTDSMTALLIKLKHRDLTKTEAETTTVETTELAVVEPANFLH